MTSRATEIIKECIQGAAAGTLRFPEVLARLSEAEVSHYHVDYLRAEETCYLRCGESHVEPVSMPSRPIAATFSAPEVAAAVRASQRDGLPYPEFLDRTRAAGCIGYVVYLDGRQVIYSGRTGEALVEPIPPSL